MGTRKKNLSDMMTCPKCGFKQKQSPECVKCGIVISKWLYKSGREKFGGHETKNKEQMVFESRKDPLSQGSISVTKTGVVESEEHVLSKDSCFKWLRKTGNELVTLALAACVTWIVYSGLLYLYQALWYLYLETLLGSSLMSDHPSAYNEICALVKLNMLQLSFDVVMVALKTCLVVGAVCQLVCITRFFYSPAGLVRRIVFWGSICGALTSFFVRNALDINWPTAFLLALVPSLCIFVPCFTFTSRLLPELSTFVNIKTLKTLQTKKSEKGPISKK